MQSLKKCLWDYLEVLMPRCYDISRKLSFLYLADSIGIKTGWEFDYFHHSIYGGHIETVDQVELTQAQKEVLDVLVSTDTQTLDALCSIVRMHRYNRSGQEIFDLVMQIKGYMGDKLDTALQIANDTFGISVPLRISMVPPPESTASKSDLFPGVSQTSQTQSSSTIHLAWAKA